MFSLHSLVDLSVIKITQKVGDKCSENFREGLALGRGAVD